MPRDIDKVLDAWFEEGPTLAADQVVGGALTQTEHLPQVRPFAPKGQPALIAAAMLVLILTIGVAIWLAQGPERVEPAPTWRVLPSEVAPLEPGRYVVGSPFPVRIGMTISTGWGSNPVGRSYAQVSYLGEGEGGGTALFFTFVEGVYADPCHLEEGYIDPPVGSTVDELAVALAGLPAVSVSGPTDTVLGGYPAVTLTLTAPASFEGCTGETDGPPFRLWGVPEWGAMFPGERLRPVDRGGGRAASRDRR